MYQDRKTPLDKLNTLLRSQRIRVAKGQPFQEVYPGDFCSELPIERYLGGEKQPLPPGHIYDVREYGAVPNDRERLATLGVNYAISLCTQQGGGVVLLSGGDYFCQTIRLKSNVTLFIEKGSRLIAAQTTGGYQNHALLFCENEKNVTVTGGGKICGEGNHFSCKPLNPPARVPTPVIDVVEMQQVYEEQLRLPHPSGYGYLLRFVHCENVQIHHVMLENAGDVSCHLHLCDRVQMHHVMIHNNRHIAGTDGVVLAGSNHVEITESFISTGGDGISLKNALWMDCKGPMGHIRVANCEIITHNNGFQIGTETTGDIFDVTVEDCFFHMTEVYPGMMTGVSITACDGGVVCDVTVRDLRMERVACPLFIRLNNRNRSADRDMADLPEGTRPKEVPLPASRERFDWKSGLRRITVERLQATDVELPIIIAGVSELTKGVKYAEAITLIDFDLKYRKCKEIYDRRLFIPEYTTSTPNSWQYCNLPAYGIWGRHVKNLTVRGFHCEPAKSTWKRCFVYEDII